MTKIAMTVWGNRISPVFDSAQTMLLADIEDGSVKNLRRDFIAGQIPQKIAQLMVDQGIDTMICGAISEEPAAILESAGIRLLAFVSGRVDVVLDLLASGQPIDEYIMPGCSATWHLLASQTVTAPKRGG